MAGVEGVVQSFSLGGRLPLGSLGSQLPCLLLHSLPLRLHLLPLLLGPKEFAGGAASYKSGSPTTSSLSRALFPSPDARDHVAPRATSSQVPRAPAEALPRPDHPPPRSPKAQRRRQAPAPRRRRCPSPGGLSPEEQARAEVRVLQRVGLPHLAGGGGRGPGSRCSGDAAAPGGAGGEAGGSDTARSSLRETEPPASGSGAPGGCPLLASAPGAWSRERWGQQDQGAARWALPGATQV